MDPNQERAIQAAFDGHVPAAEHKAALEAKNAEIAKLKEPRTLTCGMVTAMLAAIGEHDVSLSSPRRRQIHRMWDAAMAWKPAEADEQRVPK